MNRLTHKARYEAGYKLNKDVKEWQAADRLGVYENTGLTPPEVQELKERDTKKPLTDLKACPNCGRYIGDDIRPYCHSCGQRLELED